MYIIVEILFDRIDNAAALTENDREIKKVSVLQCWLKNGKKILKLEKRF